MHHLIEFPSFILFIFFSRLLGYRVIIKMDDDSFSELLCQESETFLNQELVEEDSFYHLMYHSGFDDEYVKTLGDREISFGFKRDKSFVLSEETKCARLEAIAWILKTRAFFGFRFQTAYLSVTYFDRFLSTRFIDSEKSWAVKLLSVACLSLAAKMEEIKVPALSEFQIGQFNFECSVILKMELLVLTTLDWRMRSITPFAFIHFFIAKLGNDSPPSDIISRAVALILAIMKEVNLMDHRPSNIAAAASLAALDQRLTRNALECKMNSVSHCGFLEIEDVFACYCTMQKLDKKRVKTPNIKSPDITNCSSVSAAVSNKRRRLTFNDSDQSCDIPNKKRFC